MIKDLTLVPANENKELDEHLNTKFQGNGLKPYWHTCLIVCTFIDHVINSFICPSCYGPSMMSQVYGVQNVA